LYQGPLPSFHTHPHLDKFMKSVVCPLKRISIGNQKWRRYQFSLSLSHTWCHLA
jgi:hypothetical protein